MNRKPIIDYNISLFIYHNIIILIENLMSPIAESRRPKQRKTPKSQRS